MIDEKKLSGKKFAASYSGGKDCTLAIYRAVKSGLIPSELITTYNTDADRSWFHGMTGGLMQNITASLGIPITFVKTSGQEYKENFEKALKKAKENGAEVCVFGDIDLEGHLEWCTARCENAGLTPYFPLWKKNRKKLVYEFIDNGFLSIITIVDASRMPEEFLGRILSRDVADAIEKSGADICGENGEYHTFAFDGPLFSKAVEFEVIEKRKQDKYTILSIDATAT